MAPPQRTHAAAKTPIAFWLFAAFLYSSAMYSAGLHYVMGPEKTIDLSYFIRKPEHPLKDDFKDIGRLRGRRLAYKYDNAWKITDFWPDAGFYILQARDLDRSVAPYRYRVLPTAVVGQLATWFDVPVQRAFRYFNLTVALAAALSFTWFLLALMFSPAVSLIGGLLFVTSVTVTRTLAYPMHEPATMLAVVWIFIAVLRRNVWLFLLASVCGVLTKETLMIAAPMWILETWRGAGLSRRLRDAAIAAVPIATFMIARTALGGAALEVNYGYNLAAGEVPHYWQRLTTWDTAWLLMHKVFLAFTFVWLGLLNLGKHRFLTRHAIVVPVVVLAAMLFSGGIARVLGILFPVVIPLFLLFFERPPGTSRSPAAAAAA